MVLEKHSSDWFGTPFKSIPLSSLSFFFSFFFSWHSSGCKSNAMQWREKYWLFCTVPHQILIEKFRLYGSCQLTIKWMESYLSGLHAPRKLLGIYLHLSSRCIATQGGAVSQFFCVFSPFLVDEKQRIYFFLFCLGKTSAQTSFKELPMTVSVPLVLEAYFCGCRSLCC